MIKIGDYIRTEHGKLGKCISIWERNPKRKSDRTRYLIDWGCGRAYYISQVKDVLYSENILDLLVDGDYVNGRKIYLFVYRNDDRIACIYDEPGNPHVYKDEIKNIVTREMFEDSKYKYSNVEGNDE